MAKFYCSINNGFYDSSLHDNIPENAVEITDEHHQELMLGQNVGLRIGPDENGYPISIPRPALSLETLKGITLSDIKIACDQELNVIKAGYPRGEVDSWLKQEQQARLFINGLSESTPPSVPLLTAIAAERGITVELLATKIIEKADAFEVLSGTLIGKRQALETRINEALTIEELSLISW